MVRWINTRDQPYTKKGYRMRIISNFRERDILFYHEVPPSVLDNEFNYQTKEEREYALFFKYKNQYYCVDDFMPTTDKMLKDKGWDGYHCESVWSGVLIRLDLENDKVKVATYNS